MATGCQALFGPASCSRAFRSCLVLRSADTFAGGSL